MLASSGMRNGQVSCLGDGECRTLDDAVLQCKRPDPGPQRGPLIAGPRPPAHARMCRLPPMSWPHSRLLLVLAPCKKREPLQQMHVLLIFEQRAMQRRDQFALVRLPQVFRVDILIDQQLDPIEQFRS